MSGDDDTARQAQEVEHIDMDEQLKTEFLLLRQENKTGPDFRQWLMENEGRFKVVSEEVRELAVRKWERFYPEMECPLNVTQFGKVERPPEVPKAAAFIHERMSSTPPSPPESQDVEYMTREEILVRHTFNTIDEVHLIDHDANPETHAGPWIYRPYRRNEQTGKLIVEKIPARPYKVQPLEVMYYLGSVVQDHQAVHSNSVVVQGRRWGYIFDRFFVHNGKRYDRCCWINPRVHQAGLLFERDVDRRTRRTFARRRRIVGIGGQPTGQVMYEIVGAQETDYRDLKRLFERFFMRKGSEDELADEIGLAGMPSQIIQGV